jgi:hypothetical protein
MCTFDAAAVAPYYLEISGKKHDIESHSESDSGECLMVMSDPAAALEIQRLLQEKGEALASCALKEPVADREGVPLYGHHDLSVVEARPGTAVVVAVKVRGDVAGWYAKHGQSGRGGALPAGSR